MSVLDIPKFEKLNNISVTVICFEGSDKKGSFGIAYRSQSKRENHVNLLLLSNDTSGHYCLITSMSGLLKSYKNNCHVKYYFCDICLNSFTKQSLLDDHIKYCGVHKPQVVYTPTKGETSNVEITICNLC